MDDSYLIKPIAYIYTDFDQRFGIPRQAGLIPELTAQIVFEREFRDVSSIRGLEGFSHIWLIWGFSETRVDMTADKIQWSATVAPPRLGGREKVGVFAARSPYRPNSLGLSCVKLLSIDKEGAKAPVLYVGGADIMNATPVYDIKPYVPYSDSHPEASYGFAVSKNTFLEVEFPDDLLNIIPDCKRSALMKILAQDPRGSYEKSPGYVYGLSFAGFDIRFLVEGSILKVFDVISVISGNDTEHIK